MNRRTLSYVLAGLLGMACGDDDSTPPPDLTCSTTDGQTACAGAFCEANSWCDAVLCNAGCQSSANCALGMFCDKSGTTVVGGAGVCRACGTMTDAGAPDVQSADAGASCSDVSGNYRLQSQAANPAVCSMLPVPTSAVSVSQSGSSATWTYADGDRVETLWTCELDSSRCVCAGPFTLQGVTGEVVWRVSEEEIEASAMGLICTFDARRP